MADGKRLIGHAGAVLLRRCADRTGLTQALAKVLLSSTAAGEPAHLRRHATARLERPEDITGEPPSRSATESR